MFLFVLLQVLNFFFSSVNCFDISVFTEATSFPALIVAENDVLNVMLVNLNDVEENIFNFSATLLFVDEIPCQLYYNNNNTNSIITSINNSVTISYIVPAISQSGNATATATANSFYLSSMELVLSYNNGSSSATIYELIRDNGNNNTVYFISQPIVYSVCPNNILIQAKSTVFVQGSNFFLSPIAYGLEYDTFMANLTNNNINSSLPIRCVLNNKYMFVPTSVTSDQVECLLTWPEKSVTGSYVNLTISNTGAISAVPLTGLFQSASLQLNGACEVAKPGSISDSSGNCICPAGTEDLISQCQLCQDGYYQNEQEQSSCKKCGINMDTNGTVGNTNSSLCFCSATYYLTYLANGTSVCSYCPNGMICSGANNNIIRPNFWIASANSRSVVSCQIKGACKGGEAGTNICSHQYRDVLCNVCNSGYAKKYSYCRKCPHSGVSSFLVLLIIALAIFIVYCLQKVSQLPELVDLPPYTAKSGAVAGGNINNLKFDSREKYVHIFRGSVMGMTKIILNYAQMLYFVSKMMTWSQEFQSVFSMAGEVTLTSDFFFLQCAIQWNYYQRLIFTYVSPLIFTFVVIVFHLFSHLVKRFLHKIGVLKHENGNNQHGAFANNNSNDSNSNKFDFESMMSTIYITLFIIHPSLAYQVVSIMQCESIPGTSSSRLSADFSVTCDSTTYSGFKIFSIIFLIGYIFAPLVYAVYHMMQLNKQGALVRVSIMEESLKRYSYFIRGFATKEPELYWEFLIMFRKLIIAIIASLLPDGFGLTWTSFVIVVSFFLNFMKNPFSTPFLNKLESLSLTIIYTTVLLGFYSLFRGQNAAALVLALLLNIVFLLFLLFLVIHRTSEYLLPAKYQYINRMYGATAEFIKNHTEKDHPIAMVELVSNKNIVHSNNKIDDGNFNPLYISK